MWEPVFDHVDTRDTHEKTVIGRGKKTRICKFCHRGRPDVRFRSDAHIIPAALGNRSLFSQEECDNCNNKIGSRLENELVSSLAAIRQLGLYRSRKESTKYRPPGQPSFLVSVPEQRLVQVQEDSKQGTVKFVERTGNNIALEIPLPPFSLADVCRALARMAYFVASDELMPSASHLLPWIKREVSWWPLRYYRLFVPNSGFQGVRLAVSRRVAEDGSSGFLVSLVYPMTAIIFEVPGSDGKQIQAVRIQDLKPWLGDVDEFQLVALRVNGEGRASGLKETYNIQYERRERISRDKAGN